MRSVRPERPVAGSPQGFTLTTIHDRPDCQGAQPPTTAHTQRNDACGRSDLACSQAIRTGRQFRSLRTREWQGLSYRQKIQGQHPSGKFRSRKGFAEAARNVKVVDPYVKSGSIARESAARFNKRKTGKRQGFTSPFITTLLLIQEAYTIIWVK